MPRRDRPLGLRDIAELFGVGAETPDRWRYRQPKHGPAFPHPDGLISGRTPYWWLSTMERWGRATQRWPGDDVAEARLEAEEDRVRAQWEADAAEANAELARQKIVALTAELRAAERTAEAARARADPAG